MARPEEGTAPDGRRYVQPTSRAQWRAWLVRHQDDGTGAWLVSWTKGTGKSSVPYGEAVEEALCVGWVDSTAGRLDEERRMLWFAPRKRGSGWARTNKQRVSRLSADGLLLPRGAEVVAAAKADGSWSLLDDVENLVEPDDLRAALDADPPARAAFDSFPRSARRMILEWIRQAKRPETRATRVATTVSEAHEGRRANQWRPPTSAGGRAGRP
jgi:uncharacterized protein YdeI (YjbR/CyaY-like superfamily)